MQKLSILSLALLPLFANAVSLSERLSVNNTLSESSIASNIPMRVSNPINRVLPSSSTVLPSTTSLPSPLNTPPALPLPTTSLPSSLNSTPPALPLATTSSNSGMSYTGIVQNAINLAALREAQQQQSLRLQMENSLNAGLNNGLNEVQQAQGSNIALKAQADQMLRDYATLAQQDRVANSTLVLPNTALGIASSGSSTIRYIAPQDQIVGYASANPILATGQMVIQASNEGFTEKAPDTTSISQMTYTNNQAVNPIEVGFGQGQTRPAAHDAMTMFFGGDWYSKTARAIGGQSSDAWNNQIGIWTKQYEALDKNDMTAISNWKNGIGAVLSGTKQSDVEPLDARGQRLVPITLSTNTADVLPTRGVSTSTQETPVFSGGMKIKPIERTTGLSSWVR